MTIFRLLAAVALVLSLALPASAQDTSTDAPSGAISTEANAQTDANMAVRLREILGELGGYEDVRLRNLTSGNCREGVIHRALPI